jgi:hypothetical protein
MIVGLSGYARSGKDTFAGVLVEEFGFTRVAIADVIRDFIDAQFPRPTIPQPWEERKMYPGVRRLLQHTGTEAGRGVLGEDVWINAVLDRIDEAPVEKRWVITDVRFPNEADRIKFRGGVVIRINRSGNGPANDHISEVAMDDYSFDHQIEVPDNITDPNYFRAMVRTLSRLGAFNG